MGLMEDRKLFQGTFAHGSYVIEIVNKNVTASVSYDSADLGGSISLSIKTKAGLEHLKTIIPGSIDDAIINVIELAAGL